jgi:hypothetical protein
VPLRRVSLNDETGHGKQRRKDQSSLRQGRKVENCFRPLRADQHKQNLKDRQYLFSKRLTTTVRSFMTRGKILSVFRLT